MHSAATSGGRRRRNEIASNVNRDCKLLEEFVIIYFDFFVFSDKKKTITNLFFFVEVMLFTHCDHPHFAVNQLCRTRRCEHPYQLKPRVRIFNRPLDKGNLPPH